MNIPPILDLGAISGKVLVFGGVYSNLQALESVYNFALEQNYRTENIICTGDIMGYCAQPEECLQVIKNWGIHSIAGNVEMQVRNNEMDCGCNFSSGGRCDIFSRNWYQYILDNISDDNKRWLHTLPDFIKFNYRNNKVAIIHGSWQNTSEFIFKSTHSEVKQKSFEMANSNVIIAGHSGIPFDDKYNTNLWINAGVIGMPANDGTSRVWFLTLDDSDQEESFYKFRNLSYDYQKAADLIKVNSLPVSYAETLKTGIWDNCEILPELETRQQGKPISF